MPANSLNITSSGLVSFNGTATFSGITPTNHAIQIGAASAASLTQLTGADNQLIQGHTGADPTFTATPSVTSIAIANLPVSPTDGVNKTYADLIASGFVVKLAAQASSTTALNAVYSNGAAGVGATLTNNGALAALVVDGYSVSVSDRVLVYTQASTFQNGIYVVTTVGNGAVAWVLTRSTDYDQAAEILPGTLVPVVNGTANSSTIWLETATVTTVGTDPILFNQFVFGPGNFLLKANNLSDVTSAATSRTNLGLTNVAIATTTNHDVLLGAASNGITNVAPSATSGIPLVSNGAAADPSFTTAVVAGGGTAATSFNTNGVVITGATSTTALSSVTLTSGQIVIGNTAGLPAAALITAGAGISVVTGANSITIATTSTAGAWTDEATNFSAVKSNGYFITNTAIATLPASPTQGDLIAFIVDTAALLTIQANTGQFIRFGTQISASAGTAVNTQRGDSVSLVFRSADNTWQSISFNGNWSIT